MTARLSQPIESLINHTGPEPDFAKVSRKSIFAYVDVAIVGSGYGGSIAATRLAENENGREPMRSRPLHQAADGIAKPDDTRAAPKKLIEMQHGGDYSATDVFRSGRRTELARFVLLRARTVGTTKTPSGARCFVVNTGPAHGPSTKRSQPPGRSL